MYAVPSAGHDPSHDPIRLADWVELNLLTGEETSVSVTSVADELGDIPPDDSNQSEQRSDQDDEPVRDDGQARKGYWDDAERKAEEAFGELGSRSQSLGSCYPITLVGDAALMEDSSGMIEVYRFLVLLRARHLYSEALDDDGEESGFLFEEFVTEALGAYLNTGPDHRVRFGVAKNSRGGGLPLSAKEAVEELSWRMHEDPGMVPDDASGDYRADAITWKPFRDGIPGQLVLIAQAKISEGEWMDHEPANRWTDKRPPENRLVRWVARPLTAVAFPETLSLTKREILGGSNFSSIPFDRLRLLSAIHTKPLPEDLLQRMRIWSSTIVSKLSQ